MPANELDYFTFDGIQRWDEKWGDNGEELERKVEENGVVVIMPSECDMVELLEMIERNGWKIVFEAAEVFAVRKRDD